MSIIVLPTTIPLGDQCKVGQRRYDTLDRSESTGAAQARLYGFPRWKLTLVCNEVLTRDEADDWEALTLALRGSINHLQAWDPFRAAPRGTLQSGAVTVKTTVAAGVTSLVLACGIGNAGKTLAKSDWIQLGSGLGTSQLVKLQALATANGSGDMTITFEPPLRIGFVSATAVTYIRASTYYKSVSTPEGTYNYGGQAMEGFALDLLEQWL